MNSVQKKHFENRLHAIRRLKRRELLDLRDEKMEPPLSVEEMFCAIQGGHAESNFEKALSEFSRSGPDCSKFVRHYLDTAYSYPENDARSSRNAALIAKAEKVEHRIDKLEEDLQDQVTLGEMAPLEALEKFKDVSLAEELEKP